MKSTDTEPGREPTSTATNRRGFLGTAAAHGVGVWSLGALGVASASAQEPDQGERRQRRESAPSLGLSFASIGVGIRGKDLMNGVMRFARCAALCDADADQLQDANRYLGSRYERRGLSAPSPMLCEDYRRVLERRDVDVVVIATPDHWHTKIAVEALHAGKDVYCEKPLTLTVAEGRTILNALDATGRTMLVGTQQRSDARFQQAVALVRSGRIGKPQRVTCGIGGCPTSESIPLAAPPRGLNWNRWLGPAPYVAYRESDEPTKTGYGGEFPYGRGHAHFRWWYEYAGGKLTDWGAHHVDIAMWALDKSTGDIGPYKIEPLAVTHPTPMENGMPTLDDRFNTADTFHVRVTFQDGVEIDIMDNPTEDLGFENGVMLAGDQGRVFVNRGKITGKPVEDLETNPLTADEYAALHQDAGPDGCDHMTNFFDSVTGKSTPISDVASHHRHLTVCHVANIALRLGRTLTFDPTTERFVGDDEANTFLARPYRKGFEIEV